MIRQPIVVLMGHVDHGKSSILERIKGISIVPKEAGKITQTIKAYTVPLTNIKKIGGKLLDTLKIKLTIPGLLFIDSPGHEAFTTLRKRGGNIADIAVLVIDINEGLKPQTIEAIEILKQYKTPFIVTANKIDLISGWRSSDKSLISTIEEQGESIKNTLNNKIYDLVAKLAEYGFNPERFDRVDDYTKQVAIIPISAKHSDGIPELLMILTGLAQRYLEKNLKIDVKGSGKATTLEVTEEKGIGKIIDTILYNGTIKKNDIIAIGTLREPIVTKVKALFIPEKKQSVNEVHAASPVKICAPDLDEAIAGMPIKVVNNNLEEIKKEIKSEIKETLIETEKEGIIIKADTIGSLEALTKLLRDKNIPIKRASIGDINKKDLTEAESEKNSQNRIIAGFNIKTEKNDEVKIIIHKVIYKILDDVLEYREKEQKKQESDFLQELTMPCKLKILPHCIFHKSNPAIVGVEILAGTLNKGIHLTKTGSKLTFVKEIQAEGKNVNKAKKGEQVAISLPGVTAGRQINENDILYSDIRERDFKKLKTIKEKLTEEEIQTLKEFAELKRKENSMWRV